MPAVNGVGKPCAGEPHARIDGRELETEHTGPWPRQWDTLTGNWRNLEGCRAYSEEEPPRQFPTLQPRCRRSVGVDNRDVGVRAEVRWGDHLLLMRTTGFDGVDHDVITVGEAQTDKGEVSGTSAV